MSGNWRHRLLLALALGVATKGVLEQTDPVSPLPYPRGIARLAELGFLTSPVAQNVILAAVVAMLALFVSGRRPQLAGWTLVGIALVTHAVVRSVHAQEADRTQGSQEPYATLIAWLIGTKVAKRFGREPEELGASLACGVVAAGYSMAALSKLMHSGIHWVDGRAMALLIYERAGQVPAPFSDLRYAAASHPLVCKLAMGSALVLESCGWFFLFTRLRRPFAAGVLCLHVSSGLLLGYTHFDWALTAIAWAVAAGAPLRRATVARAGHTG